MALLLPNSAFLHIHKTGGSWVRQAILAAGIPCRESGSEQEPRVLRVHHSLQESRPWLENRFVFTFVRNPLSWYQSYWCHRMTTRWRGKSRYYSRFPRDTWPAAWHREHLLDTRCRAHEFETFVEKALKTGPPGYVTVLFRAYAPPGPAVDFIGRQENLGGDLCRALDAAGERYDRSKLLALAPLNVLSRSGNWPALCKYAPGAAGRVRDAERDVFTRFGYDDNRAGGAAVE